MPPSHFLSLTRELPASLHAGPQRATHSTMEWRAEGILLSVRRHGENAVLIDVLTDAHGRHAGLVRGGAGRRHAATLQPGNQLDLTWRGRLEDQLGTFVAEPVQSRAASLMADREALTMFDAARSLLLAMLGERVAMPRLYAATLALLSALPHPELRRAAYLRWEILLLSELGFALQLDRCAVTGGSDHLAYVSPNSGRAVSSETGAAYRERLLRLPAFLTSGGSVASAHETADGLALTGHFLQHWAAAPLDMKRLPDARMRLEAMISREADCA